MGWFRQKAWVGRLHGFFRRHWPRLLAYRERYQFSETALHLLLATGVGIIGGLVNLCFYYVTESAKYFFLRKAGDPVEIAEMMNQWQRLFTPAVGGLLAGLVLYWGFKFVGRQKSANLLEVVVAGDGKLPLRSSVVNFTSSLISIVSGASIGREGSITQLSAALASRVGQFAQWPPYRLRMLVGCGAAAGIAAAYNAPITGAVFAATIVLGNFSMNLFAPLICSAVVATMVSRNFFGIERWCSVEPFEFTRLTQLPWFVVLGLFAGAGSAVFLKMLNFSEELFQRFKLPIYARLALGGLFVGLLAVQFPGVCGNGHEVTNRILHDLYAGEEFSLLFVLGLLLAKLLATAATVGSGAVGGVFTPTLFLGASLGAAFGMSLHNIHYAAGLPVSAFAAVGMGSMLAATTRSPLLALIVVFETSLDYSLMPPLMLGCAIATVVSQSLHRDSIYTEPLSRKGFEFDREQGAVEQSVGDVMRPPVTPVREWATLSELGDRFLSSPNNFIPVVNAEQTLIGVVALHDLKNFLNQSENIGVIAGDVMRPPPPCVIPSQRLVSVLPLVMNSELRNIPVVNSHQEKRLIGALSRTEVLDLFAEAINATKQQGGAR